MIALFNNKAETWIEENGARPKKSIKAVNLTLSTDMAPRSQYEDYVEPIALTVDFLDGETKKYTQWEIEEINLTFAVYSVVMNKVDTPSMASVRTRIFYGDQQMGLIQRITYLKFYDSTIGSLTFEIATIPDRIGKKKYAD
jgi:hypothetical protein